MNDEFMTNVLYESAQNEIAKHFMYQITYEKTEDGFLKRAITMLRRALEVLVNKIKKIFSSEGSKEKIDKAKERAAHDKEYKDHVVKVIDWDKRLEHNKKTLEALKKPGADVDKIMKDYYKKRSMKEKISVTIGVLLGALSIKTLHKAKEQKKAIETLEKMADEDEKALLAASEVIKNQDQQIERMGKIYELKKKQMNAMVDVIENSDADILMQIDEALKNIDYSEVLEK